MPFKIEKQTDFQIKINNSTCFIMDISIEEIHCINEKIEIENKNLIAEITYKNNNYFINNVTDSNFTSNKIPQIQKLEQTDLSPFGGNFELTFDDFSDFTNLSDISLFLYKKDIIKTTKLIPLNIKDNKLESRYVGNLDIGEYHIMINFKNKGLLTVVISL